MTTEQVYLHYLNINAEGRLPHHLEFGPLYGRLVTDQNIKGQVVTVVSFGVPRRYYVWSTFNAALRVNEYKGKTVVQGEGWHLCPPMEVPEEQISYLVGGHIRDHLFVPVHDPAFAEWLLNVADHYQPPGDPARIRHFLKKMWKTVGDEAIEKKIEKLLKTIKRKA